MTSVQDSRLNGNPCILLVLAWMDGISTSSPPSSEYAVSSSCFVRRRSPHDERPSMPNWVEGFPKVFIGAFAIPWGFSLQRALLLTVCC
ncbi:hypothetical protein K431DRAFT_112585 [Polychaeton citri CBS 116435]|uniref:Uncharacterized protein n=1 Tax=Polychaeton citri CBS 116435 TaxID=1314669 RepID=A0A9P4Q2G1_9PEZI|nr:hypothetical protein K431DRAFT_112585 [Polychaeton citri CBS 116435]